MKPLRVIAAQTASAPRPALSPARQKLGDLLHSVAQHEKRIADLRAASDRLTEIIELDACATKALVEFDHGSAAMLAEWAKPSLRPAGTEPEVNSKRRQELIVAKAVAQENSVAAFNARKQIADEIQMAALAAKALGVPIEHAIAEILAEEASGRLLADLREAVAAAHSKRTRLTAVLGAIVDIAHAGPFEEMRSIFIMMEQLDKTLKDAAAPPAPDGAADRSAWADFAAGLRSDPATEFKG